MRSRLSPILWLIFAAGTCTAKVHVIAFGKWSTVQAGEKAASLKVRTLLVDAQVKEYVFGAPHDVTERLFVVRRAFRVNDSLPDELSTRWQWQRGGWLLVDRMTGKISAVNLPEFDPVYSAASWYRDYIAYCGVSDDQKKVFAVVAQLNRRKPVLHKAISGGAIDDNAKQEPACTAPEWQRGPVRVSFDAGNAKQTFAVHGKAVDPVSVDDEEE